MTVPNRATFEAFYARIPPWDIGKPQQAFIDAADHISGTILDAGCGTGDIAIYFATRGHKVTGIDFLEEPIKQAKQKAIASSTMATFIVKDALTLKDWAESFDSVIDSGLFHAFNDEDRRCYVEGLSAVLRSGGLLFILCFSDQEPGTHGPRRVSRKEIEDAFAVGWEIESIEPGRFEVRTGLSDITFSDGGPKAWFVRVKKLNA